MVAIVLVVSAGNAAPAQTQTLKLIASDGSPDDFLSQDMAISGALAVVEDLGPSLRQGDVYIYQIPNPASGLLLGPGSLLFLVRRRTKLPHNKSRSAFSTAVYVAISTTLALQASTSLAFRVLDHSGIDGHGIQRWDADLRFFDGVERSLDGGLRYSLEGGSYAALRDKFEWMEPAPSVAKFQAAVEQAFTDWEAVDPESGLGTDLYFVPDFDTPVVIEPIPNGPEDVYRLNRGAEIDITSAVGMNSSGFTVGFIDPMLMDPIASRITLTSGVMNYPATAITGVDIRINSRDRISNAPWGLDRFQTILSHEIGQAIGLQNVDVPQHEIWSLFYDDNFDNTSVETALATMTNSFAHVIDPYDPDNSPGLMQYEPCQGPGSFGFCEGIDVPGVNIHMESSTTGDELRIGPQADDFAGRQFLYPYVAPLAGDFNGDGNVDGKDFLYWQREPGVGNLSDWLGSYGAAGSFDSVKVVPEPCAWMLTLMALLIAGSRTWLLGFRYAPASNLKPIYCQKRNPMNFASISTVALDLLTSLKSKVRCSVLTTCRSVFFTMVVAIVLVVAAGSEVLAQTQTFKLSASDGSPNDFFGQDLAISDNILVVGARNSTYLFDAITGQELHKLPVAGPVAISGNIALVGANVFDVASGLQVAKLVAPDSEGEPFFGEAVAISGNVALVGYDAQQTGENSFIGHSLYAFDVTTGQPLIRLLPADGMQFTPSTVVMSGFTAIGGAEFDSEKGNGAGSAYLFDVLTGEQIAKLVADDGGEYERFGQSVALSENTALIGANYTDVNSNLYGSAYLFDVATGQQVAKLLPDDQHPWTEFGYSVALSGNIALVGAVSGGNPNVPGSAYLFNATTGAQLGKLLPDERSVSFGNSVAISGAIATVGDSGQFQQPGTVYVYYIPEPSSALLLGLGGFPFLVRHRLTTRRHVRSRSSVRTAVCVATIAALALQASTSLAFRVGNFFELDGSGVLRWDADVRYFEGVERSLDGGLRYSLEGGSYAAFRDKFEWMEPAPTVVEFQAAVEQAFTDWEAVDPESGLGTDLYFVPDFDTPIVIEPLPINGPDADGRFAELERLNRGTEIDITSAPGMNSSGSTINYRDPTVNNTVTLTSGVQNYPSSVRTGSDIRINTRDNLHQAPWQLDRFQTVLSHEIGHAVGLRDVDVPQRGFGSLFYDDNFDNTNNETALATMTNSFAHLIDPYDPDNSPRLMQFEPCQGPGSLDFCAGIDVPGVNIHMESSTTGDELRIGPQADDFAGRQFLYPYVAPLAGDFDGDGEVDGKDFLKWQSTPSVGNLADWQASYGAASSLEPTQQIPEPSGNLLVLILGIAVVCRFRSASRTNRPCSKTAMASCG